jgi:hypothetical protein
MIETGGEGEKPVSRIGIRPKASPCHAIGLGEFVDCGESLWRVVGNRNDRGPSISCRCLLGRFIIA